MLCHVTQKAQQWTSGREVCAEVLSAWKLTGSPGKFLKPRRISLPMMSARLHLEFLHELLPPRRCDVASAPGASLAAKRETAGHVASPFADGGARSGLPMLWSRVSHLSSSKALGCDLLAILHEVTPDRTNPREVTVGVDLPFFGDLVGPCAILLGDSEQECTPVPEAPRPSSRARQQGEEGEGTPRAAHSALETRLRKRTFEDQPNPDAQGPTRTQSCGAVDNSARRRHVGRQHPPVEGVQKARASRSSGRFGYAPNDPSPPSPRRRFGRP